MAVSYSKEQRKIAKDKAIRLYSIGFSRKGGEDCIMIQGPCSDRVVGIISKAIEEIVAVQIADKNNVYL